MKELKLVLKRKWYDMIASGEKTEEYRELTEYWEKRLWEYADWSDYASCARGFDIVTFYLGYTKNRPSMSFYWLGTDIGQGKVEWGAEPGKEYFVIKLGKRYERATP